MEEINIFLDNKISIFYLSLFDNFIKDENYFKIGNYTLDNHNLDITYDNGEKFNYSYLKTDNNIKYFGDMKIINKDINETIYIVHKTWEDNLILDKNVCYRDNNEDTGKFILNNNKIIIKWDNYDEENFVYNSIDKKYYLENYDEIIDISEENSPKNNEEIEEFNYEEKYENNIEIEIDNKLFIKNNSWEDYIILNNNTQKCYRESVIDDKGTFIVENNYLYINWEQWESETFYKNDDFYVNNINYINNYQFIFDNKIEKFNMDKEFIYIKNNKYSYDFNNKKLNIHNFNLNEFIFLDNEFYYIDFFTKCIINNSNYLIFKNEDILLNHLNIIIAKYEYVNEYIINIKWYNNDNFYYKINKNNDICDIIKLDFIQMKNDFVQKYYIYENLLYDEHFNNFIEFIEMNDEKIILKNNLNYIKNDDIYVFNKPITKKEIILFEDDYNVFYYDDNFIYNSESKYLCLIDKDFKNIHIKRDGNIIIFSRLFDNHYFIEDKYKQILNNDFDEYIFKYFENHLIKENLIENILDNYIIYNKKTFYNNFTFLENIDFTLNNNIFDIYGFFKIEEYHIEKNLKEELYIINFKNNIDFLKNQDLWIEFLKNQKSNIIFIFEDYSYYEFINEIFTFENNFTNYIVIINYIRCSELIHYYINKLLYNIYNINSISKINYIIDFNNKSKQINKCEKLIINNDFIKCINKKEDLIIFIICFYIKNKSKINFDFNFKTSYNQYKNLSFM